MYSSGSRHNVGSDALIRVAQAANLQWTTMRDISCYVAVDHALQVTYLRPKSAMNDSGKPVRKALQHFRATAAECLVVHDDLERAVGKVSVKAGGGAAGHNGIRSITQCLGTESFPRLRVGIGRPADRSQVANFVLESFTPDESEVLRTTSFVEVLRLIQLHASGSLPVSLSVDTAKSAATAAAVPQESTSRQRAGGDRTCGG